MLHIFYKSVVESVISSAIICWGSSIRARDLKRLRCAKMDVSQNEEHHGQPIPLVSVARFIFSSALRLLCGFS
ncbi:hypothetical protein CHARACLAT_021794 [Characodon lateralis]|uniref:Uncharacterized protein n=1 Tax=Characodon lateralis TaxID=208331 RepID=A0ABU7CQL0_9TELE|nr:hypothetical protein [Characodon lateralis]